LQLKDWRDNVCTCIWRRRMRENQEEDDGMEGMTGLEKRQLIQFPGKSESRKDQLLVQLIKAMN